MNDHMINADTPKPEEETAVRRTYSTPLLEEHGSLHTLTHGATGLYRDFASRFQTVQGIPPVDGGPLE